VAGQAARRLEDRAKRFALIRRRLAPSSFRTVPVEPGRVSAAQPETPMITRGSLLVFRQPLQLVIGSMWPAAGGPRSASEARRLVPEKMETLAEAEAAAASVAAKGGRSHKVAAH
jgi:hypothetical protein